MGEFFERIGLAFKCFFLVLFAGRLPDNMPAKYFRVSEAPAGTEAGASAGTEAAALAGTEAGPTREGARAAGQDRAVQLLALLQRDGRLVDFLSEDIAGYPDDQVGAAVREVHASCREVLTKYVALEPIITGEEGRPTVVEPGFDLSCVKLVGSVSGRPPFRGILRHKGWRAARVELPAVPAEGARNVIAPAEVEIG